MKLIKLLCCSVLCSISYLVSASEPTSNFTPYLSIETGLVASTLNEFELKGFNLGDDNFSLKLSASYQFTPQWSVKVGVASRVSDSAAEHRVDESSEYNLTGIYYESTLYSIEGGYTIPLGESWQLGLNAGVIIGKEKEELYLCPEASFSWALVCFSGNGISTSSDESTETSFILGTSIIYTFLDNWGIKLGYSFSGYQAGLSQTEVLVQYRF